MLLVIWFAVILAAAALYFHQLHTRFSRYGVKQFKPIPIVDNMARIMLRMRHITDDTQKLYNAFPEERFVGRFEFLNPVVMIKDIELIKKITVKDFEHFLDHRSIVNENVDPFFGRNLISLKVWTDNDIVAQAVLFFIAGFDTISSAMSFALHEIAMHPEVQQRLYEEIKGHHEKNRGSLNYNSIQSLKYLDMVVSEVLRMWAPGVALDRLCIKDYNLGKPNKQATQDYIVSNRYIVRQIKTYK
ncbi:unnamed protein product [Parnassius mnemosyne]|uniref:unspecific monooxygenase n=1 Tax=Parnassius mnemosyne TaxID=213953 RepID=A0AAV1LSS3_9NEOP